MENQAETQAKNKPSINKLNKETMQKTNDPDTTNHLFIPAPQEAGLFHSNSFIILYT
jgi:hypothetical protein